jgi:YHS domain-containing protein
MGEGFPSSESVFDGHTYYFANQQGKPMFDSEPTKYVPVLGGDCAVSYAKMNKRVPGDIRHAAWHRGRLFTFANAQGKQMFLADPGAYDNADLAYGGKCIVCNVNMRQTVAGKPEFAVLHKGLRYQFPAAGPRDEFLANPEKYEVAANATRASSSGSSSRPPAGSGSSTR